MCLEDCADDVEEDTHSQRGDREREFSPYRLNEEEDENGGRNHFHDTVDTSGEQ